MKEVFFIFCCVMLCSIPSNATSADTIENTKVNVTTPFAVISDAYISQKTVKKNDVLKYQFAVSFVDTYDYDSNNFEHPPFIDKCSDYYVIVTFQSSKKQKIVKRYEWPDTVSTVTIQDEIPIQKGMQAGEWIISSIHIDNYNSEWVESEGDSLIIKNGTKEDQDNYGQFNVYYTDLSFFDFNVTGVNKKADNNAPTVNLKSLKLSKKYVKKNKSSQKVTFSVKIKDVSTIEKVECGWDISFKGNYGKCGDDAEFYTMKYNKKTKRYQCTLKMNTKMDRKAALYTIQTKDIYGNEKVYSIDLDCYEPSKKTRKYYNAYRRMVVIAK